MYAALYERLSLDDDRPGESGSIRYQKEILEAYAKSHDYPEFRHFTDDGYTGANFNRPGFQEMLSEIKSGNVSAVIVRDLSRLGRNYLETGKYIEEIFPTYGVRFLALMNDVDIQEKNDALLTPIFNLINDWYSRDLSRKQSVAYHIRQQTGRRHISAPMFGYMCHPEDPKQWIIDPVAAPVVRKIYRMGMEGMPMASIAKKLEEEQILRPSVYYYSTGRSGYGMHLTDSADVHWDDTVVNKILRSPEYKGTTTLRKTRKDHGKRHKVPERNRYYFPDTHDAIIHPFNWDAVYTRRTRHRMEKYFHPFLTLPVFPHLFLCADCGKALTPEIKRERPVLLCYNKECPGMKQKTSLAAMEKVVSAVMDVLWNSIQEPSEFLRQLSEARLAGKDMEYASQQHRMENLKQRKKEIQYQKARLKKQLKNKTLEKHLIQDLMDAYELELRKIQTEEESLATLPSLPLPPITESEAKEAMLKACFVFIDSIIVATKNKQKRSQRIQVRLRVSVPPPKYIQIKQDRVTLNIRWKVPEEAPSVSDSMLDLLSDSLIL